MNKHLDQTSNPYPMDTSLARDFKISKIVGVLCLFLPSALLSMAASNPTDPRTYRAQVTDSAGHAIAGAKVEVYRWLPERPSEMGLATNLITGADGIFELPWSSYNQLIIRKTGLAPAWWEMRPNETNNAPLVLSPPAGLSGVVVDEAGKPASQAEVFVSVAHLGGRTDWSTLLSAQFTRPMFTSRTDAAGRFRIENFPTDATAELSVAAPGKVLPPRRVQYSPGSLLWHSGQTDIRLVLELPATIEGRVETETGQPLTNAQVELRPTAYSLGVASWKSVEGVANGGFRFSGVGAGAYQLFAQFGTNETGLPDWVAEPVPVTVLPGEDVNGVVLNAAKGGVLRARSVDRRTGKPLPGIYFTLYLGSDYLHRTSDSNGLGSYRLLPGRYDLHATDDVGLHEYSPVQIEAGQTTEVTLEFSPPPHVSGIVRDPSAKPAPGLSVWPVPQLREQTKTDANGRYEIIHNENPQVVVVVDTTRNLAVSREIEEGVTNLDLQLAPALTVTGRVEDSQGKPILNAKVLPYLRSGTWGFPVSWQRIACDTNGAFRLMTMPADRAYYLQVNAPGYGSAQPEVPADEGNEIELKPTVLTKADHKLAGQVVDASGTPLGNTSVSMNGSGQPDVDLETDSNGRFALDVCPGRVHLRVRFQQLQTSVEAAAGDTNLTIVLKPRTAVSDTAPIKRATLVGKPMPSLNTINLPADAAVAGKPLLICLFDCEQRPSRQAIRVLTDRNESLQQKGVTIVSVQSIAIASESFNAWTNANHVPFRVGQITEKTAASRWATEIETLPWLILVNSQGRVVAEGFPPEEIVGKVATNLAN
jgi:protocatechuate 3,4-dioxygenase beta subunit